MKNAKSFAKKRDRRLKERFTQQVDHMSLFTEGVRIYCALLRQGFAIPQRLLRIIIEESALEPFWNPERLFDLAGDAALDLFDSLGPVYGKAAQIALSRMSPFLQGLSSKFRLNRLYGDWPALPFSEIEPILDREIPGWQQKLRIEPYPLGVASIAQVHAAVDEDGREWVVKVVKPQSIKRLDETLSALDQLLFLLQPMAITEIGRRVLKEFRELSEAMRREVSLDYEKKNINRIRDKLKTKKQQVLLIPETLDEFCSDKVITIERFAGVRLSDVVSGKVTLASDSRKQLAKRMLQELLIQVFEVGLFHGDPHAGNLILLDDGSVGLFDWGLAGELLDTDRRHIAAMLKAVIAMDPERLAEALQTMAEDSGRNVSKEEIAKEISKLGKMLTKKKAENKKPTLKELFEISLKSADRLNIPVPDGLLMMAKSLLTIEGLAKGIDPNVAFKRIATPVLFKAARPGLKDLVYLTRRVPKLVKHWRQ